MKRSFLTVLAASSVFVLGACGGDDVDTDIEPVETIEPMPAPAPAPMDTTMMMDTTMLMDTMGDTMTTTGI